MVNDWFPVTGNHLSAGKKAIIDIALHFYIRHKPNETLNQTTVAALHCKVVLLKSAQTHHSDSQISSSLHCTITSINASNQKEQQTERNHSQLLDVTLLLWQIDGGES